VSPAAVESLMGHWTYRMLSTRAGFSIWDNVYAWIRKNRNRKKAKLRGGVRGELRAAISLCALFYEHLDAERCLEVPALDASGEGSEKGFGGFGVVSTGASIPEIKEAAQWA